MVEGAWMALNRVHNPRDRVNFAPGPFYTYARRLSTTLQEFLMSIVDHCANMEQLFGNVLTTKSDHIQTVYDICMAQFRLFIDPNQRPDRERTDLNNTRRVDRIMKRVKDKFFPSSTGTSKGKRRAEQAEPIDVDTTEPVRPKRPTMGTARYEPPVLPTRKSKRQKTDHTSSTPTTSTPQKPSTATNSHTPSRGRPPSTKNNTTTLEVAPHSPIRVTAHRAEEPEFDKFDDTTPSKAPRGYENALKTVQGRPEPVLTDDMLRRLSIHPSVTRNVNELVFFGIPRKDISEQTGSSATKRAFQRVTCPKEDPTPYLRAVHVPFGHQANYLFADKHVNFIRNLAQFWGTYAQLRDLRTVGDYREDITVLTHISTVHNSPLSMGFFNAKRTELEHRGFTILPDIADPTNHLFFNNPNPPFDIPADFPRTTQTEMFEAVQKTFDKHMALDHDENSNWHSIFNHTGDKDDIDRTKGVARFSTGRAFSVNYLNRDENVWMSRYRAFMDIYLGQICHRMNIHTLNENKLRFPVTGGRFLLTGADSPAQVGHNDFDHRQQTGPGFFIIVTGFEGASIWVAEGSHKYVNYPERKKNKWARIQRMSLEQIPPHSIFIGHGYVQHAGAGWSGNHNLRYHIYLIPDGHKLKNAVSFAYGWSFKK